MNNSRYSIIVIIRVILISVNFFAVIWLLLNTDRPATTLFAFIVAVIQIISLIFYHNRILRDLSNFLVFLQENDTTLAFSKKSIERNFKGLVFQLYRINQKLQLARLEKERQFHYLQTVVKQIDTGIIAFDQEGNIELYNQAARELLGIRSLPNMNTLAGYYPELADFANQTAKPASSSLTIRKHKTDNVLAVKSSTLRFGNRTIRLITLQNIKAELEAKELDAWRKLIRIQRHEIINSLTPITTLTTAVKRRITRGGKRKKLQEITHEHVDDILKSIDVIEERSRGLIEFMERFKGLTDIPGIRMDSFRFSRIISDLPVLFSKEISAAGIRFITEITPENLIIRGDAKLLEQVMINLVKNSLEAVSKPGGMILVKAFINNQNERVIQVMDNGSGIEENALEIIFVPSYTTKEQGSGIGLSITRQIVQLHKGTIKVRSTPKKETVFEITLPE